MINSLKKGLGFGLTSGIITTLGMIIGLGFSTDSTKIVIISIFSIAIADSFSDALGVHMLEEIQIKNDAKQIWQSTFFTFLFKLIFTLSFAIAFYLLNFQLAIIVDIIYGVILIILFSVYLARNRKASIFSTIAEHLTIVFTVILLTYFIGISFKNLS